MAAAIALPLLAIGLADKPGRPYQDQIRQQRTAQEDHTKPIAAERQHEPNQAHNEKREDGGTGNSLVKLPLAIYRWIDKHNGLVNAISAFAIMLFTGVLAYFTVNLAKSTRESAEAAKLSADALVSAERSHLFVRVTLQSLQDAITRASMWGTDMDDGHIEPRLVVKYVIKNFGRTPAILREINHTLEALAELPAVPSYSPPRGLPYRGVLAAGDETPEIECMCATWTTVKMAREIASGAVPFWFFGRVVYQDVITGAEHVEPFLYVYAGAGFNPDYRPAYNQRT